VWEIDNLLLEGGDPRPLHTIITDGIKVPLLE